MKFEYGVVFSLMVLFLSVLVITSQEVITP